MKNFHLFILTIFSFNFGFSQSPIISYSTPNSFSVNEAITPLEVVNIGGSIPFEAIVTTYAGTGVAGFLNETTNNAQFNLPTVVVLDNNLDCIIADRSNHVIRKIDDLGNVSTFAGTGVIGNTDGLANMATFNFPDGAIMDSHGNLFVTDQGNHTIRKIDVLGNVTTFAGSGVAGFADGIGVVAQFSYPAAMAIDANDNLYIADYFNNRIRKITPSAIVTTVAGLNIQGATDGDNSVATFYWPTGLCLDVLGNIYVADYGNHKIRKIDTFGNVSTIAGTGVSGALDGPGNLATFFEPAVIAIDSGNNLYVTDYSNNKIRKIDVFNNVSSYAGNGSQGANDGLASEASFNNPTGIVVKNNEVFISDYGNHKIRKITDYVFTVSPNLPNGLVLNEKTGQISGTPTVVSSAQNYTISVSNEFGSDSFQTSIEVTALSTPKNTVSNIKIYPNPVSTDLTINASALITSIRLENIFGQTIKKWIPNKENISLDFSNQSSGIYFLYLESNNYSETVKVIKN